MSEDPRQGCVAGFDLRALVPSGVTRGGWPKGYLYT